MSETTRARFAAALAAGGPPIIGYVNGRAVRGVMGADDGQPAGQNGQPAGQQPPERPEGVTEQEWAALGDPGKAALVRERQRAQAAEQALAAVRQAPKPEAKPESNGDKPTGGHVDMSSLASLVQSAVSQTIAPILEREQRREAEQAAQRIRDGVLDAARTRLVDPTDALSQLDLPALTDGSGNLDAQKVGDALDNLVQRKPHLARVVDDRRSAGAGSVHGGTPGQAVPFDQQVQSALALMTAQTGLRSTT